MVTAKSHLTKHRRVYEALTRDIRSGRLKGGDRLPSEADLVRTFGVSRITAGRAVRDLQVAGVVERRAGSGTYVKGATGTGAGPSTADPRSRRHGGLRADLPGHDGLATRGRARGLVGQRHERRLRRRSARGSCAGKYIDRKVSGVFFAPLELTIGKDDANKRIAAALDAAGIPVVLLDRPALRLPRTRPSRSGWHRQSPRRLSITAHLLRLGSQRVAFVAVQNAAATVEAREAGYREALYRRTRRVAQAWRAAAAFSGVSARSSRRGASSASTRVSRARTALSPSLHTVLALGYSVPGNLRLAGIDDMDYASLLPVPLTTLRQPTREIGAAAFAAMLDRVARPALPARDILLQTQLIVRRSCGGAV
jgi:DNA-binding LacI/PurR family transcriptional regulator